MGAAARVTLLWALGNANLLDTLSFIAVCNSLVPYTVVIGIGMMCVATRSPDTSSSAAIDPVFKTTEIVKKAGWTDFPVYWSSTAHISAVQPSGRRASYINFGRAMGFVGGTWSDVHGAGAQCSDPKAGYPGDFETGEGPQGDAIRIYNHVRLVRDAG